MGERVDSYCPCLASLWARVRGDKPEERSSSKSLEMAAIPEPPEPPPSTYSTPRPAAVYTALWDFKANHQGELSFQKGDQFKVLGRSDDWWTVQKLDKNGQVTGTGIVPYNFLERAETLEAQLWFFGVMNRFEAEAILKSPENDGGKFLIRHSDSDSVGYVLSVRSWTPVKHFRILKDEDNKYHFEKSQHFTSLINLVEHYKGDGLEGIGIGNLGEPCKKKKPKIPDMCMDVPELPKEFTVSLEAEDLYVALWDFAARHEKEMSFQKGDQFSVLSRSDDWWTVQKISKDGQVLGTGIVPYNHLEKAESLEAQPWFFGTMKRPEAETVLTSPENENAAYLIRQSDRDSVGYVFSVSTLVNHFKVQKDNDDNYHLDQSAHFSSLNNLVMHYKNNSIGGMGKLSEPCKRKKPEIPKISMPEWEQPKEEFALEEELSNGVFADVYSGQWKNNMSVAIKIIKSDLDINHHEFHRELKNLAHLRHRHLISLFAVCTESPPYYIVTELMEKGSLLQFLRAPEGQKLNMKSMVDMGAQVADGMEYLEEKNTIHRDLAARNVLLGDDYICKVADVGLGRIIKEPFYDKDESKIPYRWSAPEVITNKKFSNKSDVWSFGVLLYEIITFGGIPYAEFSNKDVFEQVTKGYRMPCPAKCPELLYNIMKECWSAEPDHRPTFKSLKHQLENSITTEESTK